jgi:hypothetical protein
LLEVVASWRGVDGELEPHQRWIPRAAKEAASERLKRLDVVGVSEFDELFRRIEGCIGSIYGIGALTIYDVCLRIGALLGVPPTRIYLQRGSLEGAQALGIDIRERSLPLDAFPAEFRRLHAWEIENCLCLYKADLRRIAAAPARSLAA